MELIEYVRKGNIMNIKNYYTYKFKELKEPIEKQKSTKDNDNQNCMFDIALGHEYTPIKQVTGNSDINTQHNTINQSLNTQRQKKQLNNNGRHTKDKTQKAHSQKKHQISSKIYYI
jgi:hypothetical protein